MNNQNFRMKGGKATALPCVFLSALYRNVVIQSEIGEVLIQSNGCKKHEVERESKDVGSL